ncbi:MAG: ABC transporter ATP-binding protein [Eubacteriales bacterium]|nr:ABC transporter ATP-binding protein [Eubacteriales bacterium]
MEGKNPKKVMKIVNQYAGGYKYLITLGRCLAFISALIQMVPFILIWKIIKNVIEGENVDQIKQYGWQAVGITLLAMVIYTAALMCTHISAFRVQANLRKALVDKIAKLPLGVFDAEGSGKIRRIVNESTRATETYIAHSIPDKSVAIATPLGLAFLLLFFDWKLGLLCLVPAVIGFIFVAGMTGKEMQKKMAEYQDALEVMSNEAVEYVRGVPVVKTFGQTIHSFARFKKSIDEYEKWTVDYTISVRKSMVGFMTSVNAIFAIIVMVVIANAGNGFTPDLILNVMYYIIITPLLSVTLTKVAYAGEHEMVVLDAIERVNSILDREILPVANKRAELLDCSIAFENVSYRYEGATTDAVSKLSLQIKAGEHVAFVGPSGGGKTTTAELIARYFDATEGEVKIGGVNVKDIPSEQLMNNVSFVFQDSKLIKTTILENVRLAKPDASEEEVMEALKKAQCMDIIEKFPKGIHTVIGSKGVYVSGGEAQRIAIARAVLKDAPILVLDEATAFADPDNEAKVQKAFEALSKNKTVIMIAHRLSTVVNADRIFVLKDGALVEQGNHDKLMEHNGLYKKMYDEYTKSIEWKVGA